MCLYASSIIRAFFSMTFVIVRHTDIIVGAMGNIDDPWHAEMEACNPNDRRT